MQRLRKRQIHALPAALSPSLSDDLLVLRQGLDQRFVPVRATSDIPRTVVELSKAKGQRNHTSEKEQAVDANLGVRLKPFHR